jgi:hypothetical protein
MGLFPQFCFDPLRLPENQPRAILIPRCSETVIVAARAVVEIPSQFLLSATAANATRFSPLADVLTFLRLPLDRRENFASRLAITK